MVFFAPLTFSMWFFKPFRLLDISTSWTTSFLWLWSKDVPSYPILQAPQPPIPQQEPWTGQFGPRPPPPFPLALQVAEKTEERLKNSGLCSSEEDHCFAGFLSIPEIFLLKNVRITQMPMWPGILLPSLDTRVTSENSFVLFPNFSGHAAVKSSQLIWNLPLNGHDFYV